MTEGGSNPKRSQITLFFDLSPSKPYFIKEIVRHLAGPMSLSDIFSNKPSDVKTYIQKANKLAVFTFVKSFKRGKNAYIGTKFVCDKVH